MAGERHRGEDSGGRPLTRRKSLLDLLYRLDMFVSGLVFEFVCRRHERGIA